jgi:L-alanine-DL-glutamate epimerase-like enolase superfamily enzyme
VWQLLGGRVRENVRAMVLLDGNGKDELVASAARAKRDGFTAKN